MNNFLKLTLLFFIIGLVIFSIGVLNGEAELGFFLIFPFIISTGIISMIGVIFIFISILLYIFSFSFNKEDYYNEKFERTHEIKDKKIIRTGGVVLIGPIPILFGSNWKITITIMILAVLIILISFYIFKSFH